MSIAFVVYSIDRKYLVNLGGDKIYFFDFFSLKLISNKDGAESVLYMCY